MDDEIREAIRDFKEDNKLTHDEIKALIRCLPCDKHDETINRNNARLAVLESQKTTTQGMAGKLDWKIVGILGAIVMGLMALIKTLVIK